MAVLSAVVCVAGTGDEREDPRECLRSIAGQTLGDVETIVVEAGGEGPGAARNAGAARASGEFLAFVDAADRLPPYAFGAMVNGLRASGSDFATAAQCAAAPRVPEAPVLGTHISERPGLLGDHSATGKVWRRAFWESEGLAFPEHAGRTAEMRLVVPAHFTAGAVDVHTGRFALGPDPAAAAADAPPEELFAVVRATAGAVAAAAGEADRGDWDAHALTGVLARSLRRAAADDDGAGLGAFAEVANSYLDTVDPRVLRRLPVLDRLAWYLVRRHMPDELQRLLAFAREAGPEDLRAHAYAVRHGTRWYADYPFHDDPLAEVPQALYRLDAELDIEQRAEEARWDGPRLAVRGRLRLGFLPPDGRFRQYLRARAVNRGTGAKARVRVWIRPANAFDEPRGAVTARRDWGGYELRLDARDLTANGTWRPGEWNVDLWAVNRGVTRRARLSAPEHGAACRPPAAEVEPGVWVRPEWRRDGLVLVVDPLRARIDACAFEDGRLELSGPVAAEVLDRTRLRLTRRPGDAVLDVPMERDRAQGRFTARVPVDELTGGFAERSAAPGGPESAELWDCALVVDGRVEARVALEGDKAEGAAQVGPDRAVAVEHDGPGWAVLRVGLTAPVVAGAEWRDGELRLSGPFPVRAAAAELVLTDVDTGASTRAPASVDGEHFSAVVPDGLPDGRHRAVLDIARDDGSRERRPLVVEGALLDELPFAGSAAGGRPLSLDADSPRDPLLAAGPDAMP
ncbi:glycosyltransferase family 2 protein [Nocardiopsis sp. RSe5-2]|uniref:Glycosyltransferase family 2 protein n=1 Tax=Nocardiopsis endophytica TaxID=3018445 RepID=A0ABT4U7R2_9ACTN|nr:glycosyltransferase [Nocardiopsis endophytica]MDA2812479.1 glycosyltransferase family 2 protein [Nocardiopsis endophytica]